MKDYVQHPSRTSKGVMEDPQMISTVNQPKFQLFSHFFQGGPFLKHMCFGKLATIQKK